MSSFALIFQPEATVTVTLDNGIVANDIVVAGYDVSVSNLLESMGFNDVNIHANYWQ